MHRARVGLLVNSINADVMNFRCLWVGAGLLRAIANRCDDIS